MQYNTSQSMIRPMFVISLIVFLAIVVAPFPSTAQQSSWSWEHLSDLARIQGFGINSQGHYLAATNHGMFRSTDDGKTWILSIPDTTANFTGLITRYPGNYFLLEKFGAVYRSTDDGEHWMQTASNVPMPYGTMIQHPNGDLLVATSRGAFRSTDDGSTWTSFHIALGDTNLICLAVDSSNGIIVSAWTKGLYRTTDFGATWSNVGFPSPRIFSLAVDTSGNIYAGSTTYAPSIQRSSNLGKTWVPRYSKPLNDRDDIESIFVDRMNGVYARVHESGVARSTNEGASWYDVGVGMATRGSYAGVVLDSLGRMVFGGTYGVYRSLIPFSGVEEGALDVSTGINLNIYPNPSGMSACIYYSSVSPTRACLDILDVRGITMVTYVDEYATPGVHRADLNISNLVPGTYTCRLIADGRIIVRRLVVAR